jgi:protein SCO1
VLKRYAQAFKAGPGWRFLTGSKEDIALLRRKFGDLAPRDDHSATINVGNDKVGQWWHTNAIDNPRYLATVVGDWMDPASTANTGGRSYAEAPARLAMPGKGRKIFEQQCVMCHLPGGQSVGPGLDGVVALRGRPWVARWLASPGKMVEEKDPVAVELVSRHGDVLMPNPDLSDGDLAEVMAFLESASRPGADGLPPAAGSR